MKLTFQTIKNLCFKLRKIKILHLTLCFYLLVTPVAFFCHYYTTIPFSLNVAATPNNHALNFDGVDDYVNCGHNENLALIGALTVEVWCKLTRVDYFGVILSKGLLYSNPTQRDKGHYGLSFSDIGEISWELCFTDGLGHYSLITSSFQPPEGFKTDQWYHIAGVWDGTTNNDSIKLYIEGECVNKKKAFYNQLNLPITPTNLSIGRDSYRGSYFPPGLHFAGQLDELRILNRSLTAIEILEDYEVQGHYPKREGALLWYHMDEGIGSNLEDSSGNGYSGEIQGATWVKNVSYSNGTNDEHQDFEDLVIILLLLGLIGIIFLGIFGSLIYLNYKRNQQEDEIDIFELIEDTISETTETSELLPTETNLSESVHTQQQVLDSVDIQEYIQKIGEIRAKKERKKEGK